MCRVESRPTRRSNVDGNSVDYFTSPPGKTATAAPFRQYNHEKLSMRVGKTGATCPIRTVTCMKTHLCGIDFDGLQILLNTQFQCFSVLILIDEKTLLRTILKWVLSRYVSKNPFFSSCSICPNFPNESFPETLVKNEGPGAADASRHTTPTTPPSATTTTPPTR